MSALNLEDIETRTSNARAALESVPRGDSFELLKNAVEDIEALVEEVHALRALLANAKPFLLHHGLNIEIDLRGITADPMYTAIAARTIERGTEHAVELPSGTPSLVEGGQAQIGKMWPRSRSYRRDYVRTTWTLN